MQVILLQDVKGQGRKGELVDVNEGYARNFLVKKGLAEVATPTKINELKQKKAAADYHRQEEIKAMHALAAELKGKKFTVRIKVGQGGKVFVQGEYLPVYFLPVSGICDVLVQSSRIP